jgi:hypothetical protein
MESAIDDPAGREGPRERDLGVAIRQQDLVGDVALDLRLVARAEGVRIDPAVLADDPVDAQRLGPEAAAQRGALAPDLEAAERQPEVMREPGQEPIFESEDLDLALFLRVHRGTLGA